MFPCMRSRHSTRVYTLQPTSPQVLQLQTTKSREYPLHYDWCIFWMGFTREFPRWSSPYRKSHTPERTPFEVLININCE